MAVMQTDNFPYLPYGPAEVNKMIEEHSDLFSDVICRVCNTVLISESRMLTHYQSKKHANKVRRYIFHQKQKEDAIKLSEMSNRDCNNAVCHLCNMTFTSPVMAESHYQGKFHAKKLRMKIVKHQFAEASQTAVTETGKKGSPGRFCSICKVYFKNLLKAHQHYGGRKHINRMNKLRLIEMYGPFTVPAPNRYLCTTCRILLNSVEQYRHHISCGRHKKKKKERRKKERRKKLGLKTTEDQHPVEQSQGGDKQFTPAEGQYAPEDEEYAPEDEQYAPEDDQYAPGDWQYAPGDWQYAPGDDQYAPGDWQYASGDDQYAPGDWQYAPGDDQYAPEDDQYAPEDDQYAPGNWQYALGEDQYAPGDWQYAPEDDQYAPGDWQYASEDYQYAPGDDQYAPGDDQYAPVDCQYFTEEGQFAANYQYAPEFSEQFQYTS